MRSKKRTLLTTKVYGFNPWLDQVTAINQMMESTGQKSEAPILRDLIDEALAARRRKESTKETPEQPAASQETSEALQTIQTLLLRMIDQEQSAFRIQSLGLEVLQETLAETRAGRMASWINLIAPSLTEKGRSPEEIAKLFDSQTDEGKEFAYGLAGEIKDQLDATEATSETSTDDDDRQGKLVYDAEPSADEARVA